LADDVAGQLGDAGMQRGNAVGLICANTAEFVVGLLGAARVGLVVAPLDPALPGSEIAARLARLGARAILVGPAEAGSVPLAQLGAPAWQVRVHIAMGQTATATLETPTDAGRHAQAGAAELSTGDALVLFTSGTTDTAKMVPLTHTNVAASVRAICATYELTPADATVAVMPFFHGHGLLAVLLASLASGGCALIPDKGRFSAHTFWDDARAAGATWYSAVPAIHEILLRRPALEYPGVHDVPLRFVRSCSAALHLTTARATERRLGVPVLSAYGMTETTHQATSEPLPHRGARKPGSVGRATGVNLRVLDHEGHACPAGTEGEVWVQGRTVVRGYLANPAATARSFADGWFRTGDLGSLDEDGYLFLTGRIKNIINRGGEKISPEHVEAILSGCEGVVEAAVYGIPDAMYGERVGAVVVVSPGESVETAEILACIRNRLSPCEVPEQLRVATALPHTAKGALDRRALQDQFTR
jgi:acyl-CoA synthetase (AMP-forming)/AMP-acid ligase II